ncbi:MAG TPA: nuclear transport factor 2 family protein [Acidimicrobiia bacterium]|nr:nuclear transport factor 2 family protein [Acidimicrobiia bacterium]
MTETMTNADIVRRGYQAFNEADLETIDRLWADDVTWTTPGESTVAGTARGKDAVLAQYGRYGGETGGTFRADLIEVFEGDDGRVIGLHHNSATRGSRTLDTDCCLVVEVRDGKIASGTEHFFDLHNWDQFWS